MVRQQPGGQHDQLRALRHQAGELPVGLMLDGPQGSDRRLLAIAAALLALAAGAGAQEKTPETLVQAELSDGATVLLHETTGPCVSGARLATWVSSDKKDRVQGCYTVSASAKKVAVAWFDSEISSIPIERFKRPEGI